MEELALVTRKDVMAILGFKSLHGFNNLKKNHSDFPKQVDRDNSFSGRVCSFKKEIEQYLTNTFKYKE
jgi:hypothetical protein